MKPVKKAIFPIAGLATRFLPESKVVSKELIPLADKPLIHYTVEEAVNSSIEDIIFITRAKQKGVLEYFEKDENLEKVLKDNNKDELLKTLEEVQEINKRLTLSAVTQKKPEGDTNACFLAKDFVQNEPCAVVFSDDIVHSNKPCLEQLQEMYLTCGRPVLALKKVTPDRIPNYGIVKVEKIANRFFKIKGVVQKPSIEDAPSEYAILGRMIITPDVFEYIKNNDHTREKDRSITQAIGEMAELGKAIYGYEIEGDWLECGDIVSWYKSFFRMALEDGEKGQALKQYIKSMKL
jgi:UTP--glucose-1-phosphate uridylyltransferase